MQNKTQTDRLFKQLIIVIPILSGLTISGFLSGKIIPMPSDFPYNHGTWNAMGVGIIILTFFIISYLSYIIIKKIGSK